MPRRYCDLPSTLFRTDISDLDWSKSFHEHLVHDSGGTPRGGPCTAKFVRDYSAGARIECGADGGKQRESLTNPRRLIDRTACSSLAETYGATR
jgi:hypothetical protein